MCSQNSYHLLGCYVSGRDSLALFFYLSSKIDFNIPILLMSQLYISILRLSNLPKVTLQSQQSNESLCLVQSFSFLLQIYLIKKKNYKQVYGVV